VPKKDRFQAPIKNDYTGCPVFTNLRAEDVARYVFIMVQDPLCHKVDPAEEFQNTYLEDSEIVASTVMNRICTGYYKGVRVSVCSTGTGGPATELPLIDLITSTEADTFIRVGASGGYQPQVNPGDLVISTGAVRTEGLTKEYVSPEYPAVANYEVVLALVEAAEKMGFPYHVGVTRSDDSLYAGSAVPVNGYIQREKEEERDYWINAGILNVEREISTILTLSSLFGRRGGAVCRVGRNMLTGKTGEEKTPYDLERAEKTALEAVVVLNEWDQKKEKSNKKWLSASLIMSKARAK